METGKFNDAKHVKEIFSALYMKMDYSKFDATRVIQDVEDWKWINKEWIEKQLWSTPCWSTSILLLVSELNSSRRRLLVVEFFPGY